MVRPGYGGALDTPRTNIGDATYLDRAPDFGDISQELSFQSPSKDGNVLDQLRDGRGGQIRTPRRNPLTDRQNLPPSIGGAEFTPMLKSATRNSVRRRGKENGNNIFNTPGLDRIDENDITALPTIDNSMFSSSRQSYMDHTSLPVADSSSVASTPLALPRRNGADQGPLQDGNQLSLREQENVIDRIEKENFGLKLKIHFLEEALRKAGPGFSEAALKENTELKVDKVTMQREMHRQKKQLIVTEREVETLRSQLVEMQEKLDHHAADSHLRDEVDQLRHELEERDGDVQDLRQKLNEERDNNDQLAELQDNIEDLQADVRDKDRQLTEREDELEAMKEKLEEAEERIKDAEHKAGQDNEEDNEELEEAKETIQDLEHTIRSLETEIDELKDKMKDVTMDKERVEQNLEELQEEMADKSVVTKGLSRQIDEKVIRLQSELEKSEKDYAALESELTNANTENEQLRGTIHDLEQAKSSHDQQDGAANTRIQELELALVSQSEEKEALQARNEALDAESAGLQEDVQRLEKEIEDLEAAVEKEKAFMAEADKDLQRQYADELARLNDEISDLQADIREKDNLYDNDSEKWENDKQRLEAERDLAEDRAAGLQRTIDRLRLAEGSLSDKETQLQQAIQSENDRHRSEEGLLSKQIDDLQDALETRQTLLTSVRNELSAVRDELRQSQINYQTQANKVSTLEDALETARSARPSTMTPSRSAMTPSRSDARATQECERLREEIRLLRSAHDASNLLRGDGASFFSQRGAASPSKLKNQLSEANTKLDKVTAEKRSLQNELATIRAERDELNSALRRAGAKESDVAVIDKERLELRTSKLKLDNEIRRLKEENDALARQRKTAETALEDEIEKAAEEEERLSQEILQLQSKLRQNTSTETTDGASTRRTIRELERRIEDYETRLAAVNTGDVDVELSFIRRDLSAARQKELDFIQKESAHRDMVKNLRQEIAQLESRIHNDQVAKISTKSPARSPAKPAPAHAETTELIEELQEQLNDAEDQKIVLEEILEEARQQAEEMASDYEREIQRLQHELKKMSRERDAVLEAAAVSDSSKDKKSRSLRKSQAEIENLEHDVVQQQEMLQTLAEAESALRRKLERVRAERGAFRMSAEKLQRDLLRSQSTAEHQRLLTANGEAEAALESVVRASEGAREKHRKEVKGMVMQMEWMQARWVREASLRADAAFAKGFVQLQLDVANACNKAQLRELEHIRVNLLGNRQQLRTKVKSEEDRKPTLKTFFVMARFVARMKISARQWAGQEAVRKRIVAVTEEGKKTRRSRRLRVVEV
ncbi:hypothetical protein VHEMI07692 [[Torrubiella] hemipterigena]|uniref:Uncharacterized protein n=1 Tax=[Torrubiella] hemipterigena TaxID=1531966 RepID=A0A0A1TLT7_9HYPO|nr:hypothetical protein VHEMI07692 [[Torrubiella] hemipterigena]